MNYLQYYPTDVINGEGTRCTLFVSGCTHGCKGCYNQKSWSFSAGVLFDEAMEQQIINDLKDTRMIDDENTNTLFKNKETPIFFNRLICFLVIIY